MTSTSSYIRRLLLSLSIPSYRWLWFNSVFGSMRLITVFVARGWLVLTLTDSPFWVGAAPALRGLVQIAVGSFAGVLLDRVNRRRALLWVEVGNSVIAICIGFLVLSGRIELWHILVAAVLEGLLISVRWPAINTLIVDVVDKERLLNASAAQMLGFNLGNVVASAIAGLIIVGYGIEDAYFFAALCGLVSAYCVLFVRGNFQAKANQEAVFSAMRGGLTYIREHPILLWLIILGFLMSFLGWSNLTMLPVMARDVLGRNADGLGFLTGVGALGSLISTTIIAGLGNYQNRARLVLFSGLATAVGIVLFALSTWFPLSLLLAALMQAALMAFEVSLTASVLTVTSDEMQGRVQGIYTQVFGFTWVGGVLLGSIAEIYGAPLAIGLGGFAIGVVVMLVWRPLQRMNHLFG